MTKKWNRFTQTVHVSKFLFIAMLSLGLIALASTAWAHGEHTHPEHGLSKASQNPISSLVSVPFEFNSTFNNGPEDAFAEDLNIKPVIPMSFSENWNLVNRVIVPVIYQEEPFPGLGDVFGLGDITYQGFFTQKKSGKFIWGLGPQLDIPTGMDRLTSNQWALGPTAVGLTMPGHWVIGLLVANVWSIGGGYDDAPSVNALTAQYFINYNMSNGWYVSTAPVMTANWEADSGNQWTVPVGGGVGRVFKIGKQPVNVKLAGYYNVEKPDNASDWNLQFSFTFLFPKKPK
jgi:hypothetical protein